MSRARVVLPTPSGPTSRTAWGTAPRIIVAAAPSATACPRVRARSTTWSVRRVRPAPSSCASCASSARRRRRHRSRLPTAGDALAAAGLRGARGLAGALAGALAAPSAEPARPASSAPADPAPSAADAAAEASVARGLAGALAVDAGRRGLAGGTRLGRGLDRRVAGLDRRSVGDHGRRVGRRCGRGTRAGRPADRRLLGDLGSKQRLELGRHVAPRLVRAATGRRRRRPVAAAAVVAVVARRCRRTGPAAHVGIAVDPASPARATTVALAIHRRLVGRPTAACPAAAATRSAAPVAAATLLRDEVFRDLRLLEVLFVDERGARRPGRRSGRPDLRIPDRPERVRPRAARRGHGEILVLVGVLDIGSERCRSGRPARGRGPAGGSRLGRFGRFGRIGALDLAVLAVSATTTATTTTTAPAATRLLAVLGHAAIALGRRGGIGRGVVEFVEGEHLGLRELGFGQRAGGP